MKAPPRRLLDRARVPLAIAAGAVALRLIAGVGFANYDTLYALAWDVRPGGRRPRARAAGARRAAAPRGLGLLGPVLADARGLAGAAPLAPGARGPDAAGGGRPSDLAVERPSGNGRLAVVVEKHAPH